jgi:hypothetical protein
MKRILFSLICSVIFILSISSQENEKILSIKRYYSEISQKINDYELYFRDIQITYEVIPAIGEPVALVHVYYDMIERGGEAPYYEETVLKIEHYYQHAGRALYEELLYNEKGELVFYFARAGNGDINYEEDISWVYEERFYFWDNKLIRAVYNEDIITAPSEEDIKIGKERLVHADVIMKTVVRIGIPLPPVFYAQ